MFQLYITFFVRLWGYWQSTYLTSSAPWTKAAQHPYQTGGGAERVTEEPASNPAVGSRRVGGEENGEWKTVMKATQKVSNHGRRTQEDAVPHVVQQGALRGRQLRLL